MIVMLWNQKYGALVIPSFPEWTVSGNRIGNIESEHFDDLQFQPGENLPCYLKGLNLNFP